MSATIRVIDSDSDSLQVDRVFVDASGKLRASVSGVECCVETKESLVQAGVIVFQPLDARLAGKRPIFSELNVSGFKDRFWCVATDPRLVNGAARFNVLKRKSATVTEQQLWP